MTRITLKELADRQQAFWAEQRVAKEAYEQTPEGVAEKAEQDALNTRIREAEQRASDEEEHYKTNHPLDWAFAEGREAFYQDQRRSPPAALPRDQRRAWLEGWDSDAPSSEDSRHDR